MSNGARANTRGKNLETHVAGLLKGEYTFVAPQQFFDMRAQNKNIFSQQVATGENIYNKKRIVDFILYHPQRWPNCLVIQCKWQSSRGSVEEKYPFEVECIAQDKFPTIIILEGGGYSKGARQWLLDQQNKRNLLHVYSMGDLSRMQSEGRL